MALTFFDLPDNARHGIYQLYLRPGRLETSPSQRSYNVPLLIASTSSRVREETVALTYGRTTVVLETEPWTEESERSGQWVYKSVTPDMLRYVSKWVFRA